VDTEKDERGTIRFAVCSSPLEIVCRPIHVLATLHNPDHSGLGVEVEAAEETIEGGIRVRRDAAVTDYLLEADRQTVADIYRAMARLSPRLLLVVRVSC